MPSVSFREPTGASPVAHTHSSWPPHLIPPLRCAVVTSPGQDGSVIVTWFLLFASDALLPALIITREKFSCPWDSDLLLKHNFSVLFMVQLQVVKLLINSCRPPQPETWWVSLALDEKDFEFYHIIQNISLSSQLDHLAIWLSSFGVYLSSPFGSLLPRLRVSISPWLLGGRTFLASGL